MAMALPAAAIVAGSLISSSSQKSAANKAAKAQQNAAETANQTQQQMFNQTRSDALPRINAGNAASNQLAYLLGLTPQQAPGVDFNGNITSGSNNSNQGTYDPSTGQWTPNPNATSDSNAISHDQAIQEYQAAGGDGGEPDLQAWLSRVHPEQSVNNINQQSPANPYADGGAFANVNQNTGDYGSLAKSFTSQDFMNNMDPAYQWDIQQGLAALQRTQSANGGIQSGAAAKAISDYGQNQASNEYQKAYDRFNTNQSNLFNRLSGVAGTGQQAANTSATAGTNTANQIGNNLTGAGSAQGAAYTAGANANSTAYGNIAGQAGNIANGFSGLFGNTNIGSSGIPQGGFSGATGVPFNTQFEF